MKKVFSILSLALVLAGCTKQVAQQDEQIMAEFTVSAENGAAVKAAIDGDGAGANVQRFVMEIYCKVNGQSVLYTRAEKAATTEQGVKKAKFETPFVKNQEYDVLFWADASDAGTDGYYDTQSLKAVKFKGEYKGNLDARDAFFAAENLTTTDTQAAFTKDITLVRPFGQLNVITTDIAALEALSGTAVLPDSVFVTYQAPTTINVLDGTLSDVATITSKVKPYYLLDKTTSDAAAKWSLSMDYILASSKTAADVKNIGLKIKSDYSVILDTTLPNIPIQRNYRTNVIGNFLTIGGTFNVELDPLWTGELDVNL